MSNIICVTNRGLCKESFLHRIEKIAKSNTKSIVLREKDLNELDYCELASQILTICNKYNKELVLHYYPNAARKLGVKKLHLPLHILKNMTSEEISYFDTLGASCHSVDDAIMAQKLGCTYIFAGHIFETDCKKGLKGRGLEFLNEVCHSVTIPVYAIGGISGDNYSLVKLNGANGCAVMSGLMECDNVDDYINSFGE